VELAGFSEFDPELQFLKNWFRQHEPRYYLRVEKEKNIALLPLDGNFLVRDRNSWGSLQKKHGHAKAWGTTAQGVYKLGDNIEFKIYLRDQSNKHWLSPNKKSYNLKVYDPQRKKVYEKSDIELSQFGAFDGSFKVPEQGAIGWYRFELTADYTTFNWTPLTVLVSDFTPSPFKVSTELNGEQFKAGDTLTINASSTLHSGGPYTDADVRITARLKVKNYQTKNPLASGFTFGASSGQYLNAAQTNLLDRQGKMNNQGEFNETLKLPETNVYYASLMVESAVMDDRGKYVAASKTANFFGRNRFVGLRNTRWIYNSDKPASIEALVVDDKDKILKNVAINIKIQRHEYKVSRVKGPGNAYLTRNISTWLDISNCKIKSGKTAVKCTFTPDIAGSYQFIATIKDDQGREHKTTIGGWVVGQGYVSWQQSNDATLAIIAEQNNYKVGAKARYLVKNPYPGAQALITIERYGVLDSWVQEFKTSTPIIEFPVKADYLPGFYLSVVLVSPRVDKPLGPGKVDLGKPAFRMGYITANVSDPYKQLKVTVETERAVYKPRDKIKATIQVTSEHNKNNAPYEIAVAVIDESVLALNLKGKKYYDPYAGFNKLDVLDLNNYSLISRLVGKQKFEKKGANSGGDGGGAAYATIRNLFKFVSYWNPAILPDKNGSA
ncbi:MAG: MG2 domain-containing protein, partial [Thiohalomonadales bacterium]